MQQPLAQHTFLLLGGEGFIGRNLAEYFSVKYPCVSVGGIKSRFEKRGDVFLLAKPYEEKVVHKGSIIVHLIDNKVPADSFLEEEKKLVENIGLSKMHHLIVFSSAAVYVNPDSEYGQRKQMLEKFYMEYCEKQGILLTILRLFNTFGSYQIPYRQGSLVGNLLYNSLNDKRTEISDREATRDFLYAGDVPKFVEYVMRERIAGICDIGSGQLTSVQELIDLLEEKVVKQKLDIVYRNERDLTAGKFAESAIIKNLDLITLEEGLKKTVGFYEDNMPIVKSYVN